MNKNIVLLHGWGASVKKLNPLEKELEMLGWNVLSLELPGFDAEEPAKPWGLQEYVDYVVKESNKFKKYYVFGHSFGGRVAMKMALLDKNKLDGIILCASGGMSRGNVVKRWIFWVLAKVGKILNIFPPLANIWRKILYKMLREHDYEKASVVMKETMKRVISESFKKSSKKISIPALILWGKVDKMTPIKDGRLLHKNIKKSKLVEYENQGHKLPYELPNKLAKEIDEWQKNLS